MCYLHNEVLTFLNILVYLSFVQEEAPKKKKAKTEPKKAAPKKPATPKKSPAKKAATPKKKKEEKKEGKTMVVDNHRSSTCVHIIIFHE